MDKKEVFLQELSKVWHGDAKMIDYCFKESAYIVELDNGDILSIKKPRIETSFCFGYGYCGVSTQEDSNGATRCAEIARTQSDYFLKENLAGLNEMIDLLKSDKRAFKYVSYIGLTPEDKLKSIQFYDYWQAPHKTAIELTPAERSALIAGYEEVKKAFTKRLNAYLKRYGTSKLKVWTYLRD